MFWGCIVTEGKPYTLPVESEYELLHISTAALSRASEPGKTYIMITKENDTFTIGSVQKDKTEMLTLDLFVRASQGIKFAVVGKAEVHITGYFEASESGDLDDELLGHMADIPEFDEEEEEDESEGEDIEKKKPEKKAEKKVEKKAEKKVEKKVEKKAEPAKKKEDPKKKSETEQFGGENLGEEEEDDAELDLLGDDGSDEEEADDAALRRIIAEKKHAPAKPLPPPHKEGKKMKHEGKKQK